LKEKIFKVCPKSGEKRGLNGNFRLYWPLFLIIGFIFFVWVVIRVIPKPSWVQYPCQQMAIPFATGFLIAVAGIFGSAFSFKKVKERTAQRRYIIGPSSIVLSLFLALLKVAFHPENHLLRHGFQLMLLISLLVLPKGFFLVGLFGFIMPQLIKG